MTSKGRKMKKNKLRHFYNTNITKLAGRVLHGST